VTDGELTRQLATWLPGQRWFAGSGQPAREVTVVSDVVVVAGDPEFRHLLVDVGAGQEATRYQVPAGFRGQLPPSLADAAIGRVPGGLIAYDALRDPDFAAVLLQAMAGEAVIGPLRFTPEPWARVDPAARGRPLIADQSNTSIVFGESAILKVLRRPCPGQHPDLELTAALARRGSSLVAAPLGWAEFVLDSAEPTVLAILSRYFPGAHSGWALATVSVQHGEPEFAPEASLLGRATATLHAELAEAFGTAPLDREALAAMSQGMLAELDQALAVVPGLAKHATELRECFAAVARFSSTVPAQRIHGDYHLAQVLRTDSGWVVLDFEGEPSVPLTQRRAFGPPLRDVAGMLRSFDYVARQQVIGLPSGHRLRVRALDWASGCQQAFLDGYAAVGPDPRDSQALLRALMLQKAVYEAVYEARHRPGWLDIPLSAIAAA
jgi:maltokinase